jgi:hypothetical protein
MMFETVRMNLRDAVRGLRRSPGATCAIVAMLALAIGANATMFDIVDRLLLRPPDHLVDPDRLRLVYAQRSTLSLPQFARSLTYPDIEDLRLRSAPSSNANPNGVPSSKPSRLPMLA